MKPTIKGLITIFAIVYVIFSLIVLFNLIHSCSQYIEKEGLKSILTEIWEGNDQEPN